MSAPVRAVAVFCGSRPGTRAEYHDAAKTLGYALAKRGIKLVYGGGAVGMMGIIADAVLDGGGQVFGVIPRSMTDREFAHPGVQDLRIVESMAQRKNIMLSEADAAIVLPGGIGTADEMFEVATLDTLRLTDCALGVANVLGFYDALLAWLEHAVVEGYLPRAWLDRLAVDPDPVALLDRMQTGSR